MRNPKDVEREREIKEQYENKGYTSHDSERRARWDAEKERELRYKKDVNDD